MWTYSPSTSAGGRADGRRVGNGWRRTPGMDQWIIGVQAVQPAQTCTKEIVQAGKPAPQHVGPHSPCIPHGDVSRKHCRIIKDDNGIRLEDLGSSNGTYHNGTRVGKDTVLQPGDSIQVGPVVFVLQVDGVPADEDLHPITAESAAGGE